MTMGLTDTIVVGRHSAVELGYMALGWAVSSTMLGTSMGLLSGVQVMASRASGEGNTRPAGAARGATGPLLVLAISMPSFALSSAAASWLEGLGRMTPPMLLMWIANVLNL